MVKIKFLLITILMLSFLSGCAQMNPVKTVQGNEVHGVDRNTADDHDTLAKHYEDEAKKMQSRLQEHKKRLRDYEEHSYYYGRRGQEFQSHTSANIRYYENAVEENLKEAAIHRKMAQDKRKHNFTTDAKKHDIGLAKEENEADSQLN